MNYLENDHPSLKDIENFVALYVHHCWYKLGLQLLDPRDAAFLKGLRNQYQNSSDQCTEVFIHWLEAKNYLEQDFGSIKIKIG